MSTRSTLRGTQSTRLIPFRLHVGAVGHRDPAEPERLRQEILGRISQIPALLGTQASTPVRFTVVSALADGADQLIVSTLLDELGEEASLHAVIPSTVGEYARQLDPRGRFLELLDRADRRTELHFGGSPAASYATAARFIVRHSDLMLALWDGHDARGQGGTAETVHYAHTRGAEVIVVATARAKEPQQPPLPAPAPAFGSPAARRLIRDYVQLDRYNTADDGAHAVRRERALLHERLGPLARGTSLEDPFDQVTGWAAPRLARADALAARYQQWFTRANDLVFLLAALAAIIVASQALLHAPRWVVWLEVGLMALLVWVFGWARGARLLDRWLGYRSLAEAFRSGMFIALVQKELDERPRVESSAQEGLPDLASPLQAWHQRVFSEAWRNRPVVLVSDADAPALAQVISVGWLQEQARYHRAVCRRDRRRQTTLNWAILALFGATLLVAVMHGLGAVGSPAGEETLPLLAISLPVVGGAIAGIRDQRSYCLHAARSARTADGLEEISEWLVEERSLPRIRRLMLDAQSLIESERQNWSGVVEFQALELVL
jgi:hypothetical protein